MPLYRYEALSKSGHQKTATLEAGGVESVKEFLRARSLMPVKIELVSSSDMGFSFKSLFEKKPDNRTIILFTKQLAVLLRSGVPLLASIELLTNQFEGQFKRVLITIKDNLKGGDSFAASLERYPKIFSNIYIQLIRAGEASGKLDIILDKLTDYITRAQETQKKIKSAMSYPLILLGFSTVVVVGLLTFVVPKIVSNFESTGGELPAPTKVLIAVSDFFVNHYLVLLGSLAFIVSSFLSFRSTSYGRAFIDRMILRIPLISYFSRTKAVVQFSKTLGMLLDSGVHLSEALDIVVNIIDNTSLTRSLKGARDKIIKEGKIALYLKETNMFPPIANYMIQTGEESGKLSDMLLYVGNEYDNELSEIVDSLIGKINPLMMMVIGGIIFFIVLGMFLPMLNQGENLGI